MKMRQLILDVHLLENNTKDFPTPTVPKCLFRATQIFIGDDVKPALLATEYLAKHIGMDTQKLENFDESNS